MGEAVIVDSDPISKASELVVAALRTSVAERNGARFAISGGSAAATLGKIVAALPDDVWKKVQLTWVDERCVPQESPLSNRGDAYRQGWLKKDRPPGYELPLWLDGETPEKATRRVRQSIENVFRSKLDVVLMGIGEDGHIASLFAGHPARFVKGPVTTLNDSPKPPAERITLTYELLRTSRTTFILGMGEAKRAALERVVAGDPLAPANALPELTIVTDLELRGQT